MSGACPAIPRLPPTGTSYNPGMPPLPEYCCAVISDPRGWLVLQLRPALSAHAADQLTCFGGRREEGEDALSCLMRELDEELGWRPHSATACCELWKGARLVARFYRVLPVAACSAFTVEADSHLIAAPWPSLPGLPVSPWHRLVLDAIAHGRTRIVLENAG